MKRRKPTEEELDLMLRRDRKITEDKIRKIKEKLKNPNISKSEKESLEHINDVWENYIKELYGDNYKN